MKTGSSTIPWIKNPHDTDYAIFFDDVGDAILAYKNFHKYIDEKPSNNCVMIHTNAINTPRYCWWAYELLFAKVLSGDMGNLYQYRDMKEFLENPTMEKKRGISQGISMIVSSKYGATQNTSMKTQKYSTMSISGSACLRRATST